MLKEVNGIVGKGSSGFRRTDRDRRGAAFLDEDPQEHLFWSAYVLTRPLGAMRGDTLTKPVAHGGLNLLRITTSFVIAAAMVIMVAWTWRRERNRLTPQVTS